MAHDALPPEEPPAEPLSLAVGDRVRVQMNGFVTEQRVVKLDEKSPLAIHVSVVGRVHRNRVTRL